MPSLPNVNINGRLESHKTTQIRIDGFLYRTVSSIKWSIKADGREMKKGNQNKIVGYSSPTVSFTSDIVLLRSEYEVLIDKLQLKSPNAPIIDIPFNIDISILKQGLPSLNYQIQVVGLESSDDGSEQDKAHEETLKCVVYDILRNGKSLAGVQL